MPFDLSRHGGDGVGGEPVATPRSVAANGLHQRHAGHLEQVVGFDAASAVPLGHGVCQVQGEQDGLLQGSFPAGGVTTAFDTRQDLFCALVVVGAGRIDG
jgi:hypothetical protein